MTDARAFDPNRLPWLAEPATPVRRSQVPTSLLFALLAAFLVGGLSFWLGQRAGDGAESERAEPFREVVVPMPAPAPVQRAEPPAPPAPAPVIEPAPPPPVRAIEPTARAERTEVKRTAASPRVTARKPVRRKAAPVRRNVAPKAPPKLVPRSPWYSAAADGQLVRVGTFRSRSQARRGWSRLARVYPGVKRLPAVIAPVPSRRNGQYYYRLQIGTTSQAHSAVLCQRMRIIGQSCVTVGTPTRRRGMPQ